MRPTKRADLQRFQALEALAVSTAVSDTIVFLPVEASGTEENKEEDEAEAAKGTGTTEGEEVPSTAEVVEEAEVDGQGRGSWL